MTKRQLRQLQNVTAVGEGKKWRNGKKTDEDAIIVFVTKKEEVSPDQYVPKVVDEGQTDVYEIGDIELARRTKNRPLRGGISIGHRDVTCGTLGAIVKRYGRDYLLTNNHVGVADYRGGKIGDEVLQPGVFDGGTEVVGKVADFEPIKFDDENVVDVCLIKPSVDVEYSIIEIAGMGFPRRAKVGEIVKKSGRTTGLTNGEVLATGVEAWVYLKDENGDRQLSTWVDQVFVKQSKYDFIDGGDSGSLVLDQNNNPVGLVYAAAPSVGIFNNIDNIIKRLDIEFQATADQKYYVALGENWYTAPIMGETKTTVNLNLRTSPKLNQDNWVTTLPVGQKLTLKDYAGKHDGYEWCEVVVG